MKEGGAASAAPPPVDLAVALVGAGVAGIAGVTGVAAILLAGVAAEVGAASHRAEHEGASHHDHREALHRVSSFRPPRVAGASLWVLVRFWCDQVAKRFLPTLLRFSNARQWSR